MGAGRVAEIAKALIAGGRDETTPVAAVRFGTRPDQRTVRATLGTIADAGVESPSAIVVGDVAALDFSWFERRPLFGRTVVVTRAREQASELRARLVALGATVLELPAIRIAPIDFALPDLAAFDWIVFTSANGVDAFFDRGLAPVESRRPRARAGADRGDRARHRGRAGAARAARRPRARAVRRRVAARRVPGRRRARAARPRRVGARRAARGSGAQGLRRRGARGVPHRARARRSRRRSPGCARATVDAITFTSSSTVDNFCDAVGVRFPSRSRASSRSVR